MKEDLWPLGGGMRITTQLAYPANSNRLDSTSVGKLTTRRYAYDAAGNMVTRFLSTTQRLDVAYNQRNRPVTVTRSGGVNEVSRYAFNALEQMVSRRTTAPGGPKGPVHYIYGLDGALLAEADGATGATLRDYIWLPAEEAMPEAVNDNVDAASATPLPLALVTGVDTATPRLLMVHTDHLRRPIRLTDMSRATVWQASYDPFGLPLAVTGTVAQNLRFPGQYFLLETGLAYNWHRFYDPATGRYTQPDPLRFVDGPSVFGYAGGSPLMSVDPEGLDDAGYRGVLDAMSVLGIPHEPYPPLSPAMCMAKPVSCTATCNVQQIDPAAYCPDRVSGGPSSNLSEEKACREAKRQATQSVPSGCYPRHCSCSCN